MLRQKEICSQDNSSDSFNWQTIHQDWSLTVNHLCSSCKVQPESDTDLSHCPTCRTAMEAFLKETLQSFLQANHTCSWLAYTLLEALYSSNLDDKDSQQSLATATEPTPPSTTGCITSQLQANIGWSKLFQGHLVQEWSLLQEAFLANLPHHQQPNHYKHYKGTIWARN